MQDANVSLLWRQPEIASQFRTGVCLHGHTMHSEECLSFLPRYLRYVPVVSQIVRRYERGPDPAVDFSRAYWTPPLTPASALQLERYQILNLGLRPIVSLTDHDNIEAGAALQVAADPREVPISVEWTAPYRRTIFHIGVHNLPADGARAWMSAMAAYTLARNEQLLPGILATLSEIPDVLIVLNHPFWLEEGIDEDDHQRALPLLLRECGSWLHALELNGTRNWAENEAVLDLARETTKPIVSGGDRHACEASACLNLTNARSFSEFAAEVRDGHSHVSFLPHYREPMPLRIMEASWDILRDYPEYPDREHWTDRVYYRGDDGVARPLTALWRDGAPWVVRPANALLHCMTSPGLRLAVRYLLSRRHEVRS
jgi:hypothetical protein